MTVPTGFGNYPPGVTDNDPHFEDMDDYDDEEPDEYEEALGNCYDCETCGNSGDVNHSECPDCIQCPECDGTGDTGNWYGDPQVPGGTRSLPCDRCRGSGRLPTAPSQSEASQSDTEAKDV
jgi:hypothetical protein